jgi:rod shape determining protein RodA
LASLTPYFLRELVRKLARVGGRINWAIVAAVMVLCAAGIVTIHEYAQYSPTVRDDTGIRQIVYLGLAVVGLVVLQLFNYQTLSRAAWVLYALSFFPVLYTVVGSTIGGQNPLPGVSMRNGAYNWINLPFLSIQPAELMKIAFILALARYLRFRENHRKLSGLLVSFALCLGPVLLILKQPDLGTALVFLPTLLAMLFAAGAKLAHMMVVIVLGLMLMPVVWLSGQEHVPVLKHFPELMKKYQRDRVYALFRDDAATLRGVGYQQNMAVIAFGSGGIWGKGRGEIPVGQQVPEGHNDMIFALIGEQFGLAGAVIVVLCYLVIFIAGAEVAGATKEPFGRLVAIGLVTILATQAFLNIGVAIRLFPVTGVTLPFVSAGGSSLIASFIAAGILLNIGRNRPLVMARDSFEFDG